VKERTSHEALHVLQTHLDPTHYFRQPCWPISLLQVANCLSFVVGSLVTGLARNHVSFLTGRFIAGIGEQQEGAAPPTAPPAPVAAAAPAPPATAAAMQQPCSSHAAAEYGIHSYTGPGARAFYVATAGAMSSSQNCSTVAVTAVSAPVCLQQLRGASLISPVCWHTTNPQITNMLAAAERCITRICLHSMSESAVRIWQM